MKYVDKKFKPNSDLSIDAILHLLNDKNLCIHKGTYKNLNHFKGLLEKHNIPYEKIHVRDYNNCVIVELDEMISGLGPVIELDVSPHKKKEENGDYYGR